MKKLSLIYKNIVVIFMLLIMGYLAISSFFLVADIPLDGVSEKTVFHMAIWPLTLILTVVLLFLLCKFKTKLTAFDNKKLLFSLLVYDFLLCVLWIVLSNTKEGADQAQVLYAAWQFSYNDFSKLVVDQYMGMYPFQLPLALLFEPFYKLFGEVTPFLWQLINALLIVAIQYLLNKIVHFLCKNEIIITIFLLLQFLNLPLILYVAFVYGTIIGLALTLLAVYLLLLYTKVPKWYHLLLSSFCIAWACLLRSNYIIAFIAFLVTAFLLALQNKKTILLIIPLSLVFFFGGKQVVFDIYEMRSGMTICEGEPSSLWIAMGLSDNEERAAGWYNGYTWDTYLELNCDNEVASQFASEQISDALHRFLSSPAYALRFFTAKINSTWLNPDFQGLWNNDHHGHYVARAPIISSLSSGALHTLSNLILGNIQFWIYLGAFLCFLGYRKKIDYKQCVLATIFIGGFLFHLFWETKAQYVIAYYVLLFPYAAAGFHWLSDKIVNRKNVGQA